MNERTTNETNERTNGRTNDIPRSIGRGSQQDFGPWALGQQRCGRDIGRPLMQLNGILIHTAGRRAVRIDRGYPADLRLLLCFVQAAASG
eukprot:scaffold633273_cov24-Prasinocladus_malaysianus.AAC.1